MLAGYGNRRDTNIYQISTAFEPQIGFIESIALSSKAQVIKRGLLPMAELLNRLLLCESSHTLFPLKTLHLRDQVTYDRRPEIIINTECYIIHYIR